MTRVYVVDDDEAVRDSLAILLESAGLTVEAFASAPPVLERCEVLVPDCIVIVLGLCWFLVLDFL